METTRLYLDQLLNELFLLLYFSLIIDAVSHRPNSTLQLQC